MFQKGQGFLKIFKQIINHTRKKKKINWSIGFYTLFCSFGPAWTAILFRLFKYAIQNTELPKRH